MLYERGAKHQSDARSRASPFPRGLRQHGHERRARDCAARASDSLVLLDGDELSDIMLDYKVGVSVRETLTLVSIDSDYFEDDYDTLG